MSVRFRCLADLFTHLAEIDVHLTGSIRPNSGEQIPAQPRASIVEPASVAREEDGARAVPVANAYHIAFLKGGPVGLALKRVVEMLAPCVTKERDRVPIPACPPRISKIFFQYLAFAYQAT